MKCKFYVYSLAKVYLFLSKLFLFLFHLLLLLFFFFGFDLYPLICTNECVCCCPYKIYVSYCIVSFRGREPLLRFARYLPFHYANTFKGLLEHNVGEGGNVPVFVGISHRLETIWFSRFQVNPLLPTLCGQQ